jgi:hypothetical protein
MLYKDIKAKYSILLYNKYNFNKSRFYIGIGGTQWIITQVLDNKRLYLVSETNRDFTLVLEAIFSNSIALNPAVIIKGA